MSSALGIFPLLLSIKSTRKDHSGKRTDPKRYTALPLQHTDYACECQVSHSCLIPKAHLWSVAAGRKKKDLRNLRDGNNLQMGLPWDLSPPTTIWKIPEGPYSIMPKRVDETVRAHYEGGRLESAKNDVGSTGLEGSATFTWNFFVLAGHTCCSVSPPPVLLS